MNEKDKERAQRFGAYIRALREAQGKSQQEVATACGYTSRAAISSVEKGKNDIAFDRLPLLAHSLGVEPKELFEVYANDKATDTERRAQVETIRQALNTLTPEQLQQVAAIVRVMIAQNGGNK